MYKDDIKGKISFVKRCFKNQEIYSDFHKMFCRMLYSLHIHQDVKKVTPVTDGLS